MKLKKFLILIFGIVIVFACSSEKRKSSTDTLNFKTFKIIDKQSLSKIEECGTIKKAFKLETTENSLIGELNRVIIEKRTGDILIGDFETTNRVLRFSSTGKFLRSYGKIGEGPGEYNALMDFGVTSNGDIILLGNLKIIKLSKEGQLLLETRINFFSDFMEIVDDALYIPVLRFRSSPKEKKAILVINSFLKEIGGIGTYDTRLEKYCFLPWNMLAKKASLLYYIDIYDLTLNIYDTRFKNLTRLPIPNNNSQLNGIWGKKRLIRTDEEEICRRLNRFNNIFSFKNHLLLIEDNSQKSGFILWMLNSEKNELSFLQYKSLCRDSKLKVQLDLGFHKIVGSYDKGIIGAFTDEDEFNRFKADYPALKDLQFNIDDNPIIAFFEFKDELTR